MIKNALRVENDARGTAVLIKMHLPKEYAMPQNIIDFEDAVRKGDHIVRGTAADGMIRALAINAHDTVQTAREKHGTSPLVTAALGRLMMGGQMMGAMFKNPGELITLSVKGNGPIGGLTVTANTDGQVKGYPDHSDVWLPLKPNGKLDVGAGIGQGTLTVIRDQPGTEPYSSRVELATGEIGGDLTYYFLMSDQVPTSVGVGVLVDRDTSVRQAGGFILQLMPGYENAVVDQLEANLKGVKSVTDMFEAGMTPTNVLEYLLRDMDYLELETMPAEFHCGCSEERALRAMRTLTAEDIQDMVDKGEPVETTCEFCGKTYRFDPAALKDLLQQKQDGE